MRGDAAWTVREGIVLFNSVVHVKIFFIKSESHEKLIKECYVTVI